MTCGHEIGMILLCRLKECVEFDLPVAEHIGIGCTALLVFSEHVVDDPFPIGFAQIHHVEGDAQFFGHQLSKYHVFVPGTIGINDTCFIVPVDHKQPD